MLKAPRHGTTSPPLVEFLASVDTDGLDLKREPYTGREIEFLRVHSHSIVPGGLLVTS